MIDIHSHILFGVDSGPTTIEESLELLKDAEKLGYKGVVCSSHFYPGIIENENYDENFRLLQAKVKDEGILINLYKGNEAVVHTETLLKIQKVNCINDGRYILVEVDPGTEYKECKKFLKKLQKIGYFPILAHVERYTNFTLKELIKLYHLGIILQMNIREIEKCETDIGYLLLNHYIEVVATDCHTLKDRNYNLEKQLCKLKKIVGEEYFRYISEDVPYRIVNDIKVEKQIKENSAIKIFLNVIIRLGKKVKIIK